MISMTCPGCGAKLKAPDDAVGKRTRCPKCSTEVTVAEPVYDAEYAAAEPNDPYGFDDVQPMPLASAGGGGSGGGEARKSCPMCGEMILASAAKCRFCGEVFDPTLKKAEAKKRKGKGSYGPGDDDMSTGDWVIALLCSGIGCIAGIVWMIQGKPKGKKMFGISFLMVVVWNVVRFGIEAANQQQ